MKRLRKHQRQHHAALDAFSTDYDFPGHDRAAIRPCEDLVPISAINVNTMALIVNAKMPITTVAEFVSLCARGLKS